MKQQLNEIVKLGIAELEKRKGEIIGEAIKTLEEKSESLKEQLKLLLELPLPKDFFDLLLRPGVKLWISKLKSSDPSHGVDNVRIQIGGYLLTHGEDSINLSSGAYRFVLLAIPQNIPKERWHGNYWYDDYGARVEKEQD